LHFDESRRGQTYALALALFVLGLLTKTVTATLPAALLVIFWWQRGSLSWRRDVQPLVPFFLLGAVAGLFTAWVERTLIGAEGAEFQMSLVQRVLLAGRAPWFYLTKLLWPANLIFVYPRWELSPLVWWQWLFPLATLGVLVLLFSLRHRTRSPLAGWLLFVGTLFPVLGFFNVYPFLYSFVADHFQYLASLGIITLAAAAIVLGLERLFPGATWERTAMCVVLVGTLGMLTWQQNEMYSDIETLYRTTTEKNPACWMAHYNLGILLGKTGRTQEAIERYREALKHKPDLADAHNNLGLQLANAGRREEAIDHYRRAIQSKTEYAEPHNNLGIVLLAMGRTQEASQHFEQAIRLSPGFAEAYSNLGSALTASGKSQEAIRQCREAVRLEPENANFQYNLGVSLAKAGRTQEAIGQFEKTALLDPQHVQAYTSIMTAYVDSQRPAEAVAAAEQAVKVARSTGQTALAEQIEGWLANYRASTANPTPPSP
jgi:tetratricopeptide (TPR) repeat protein